MSDAVDTSFDDILRKLDEAWQRWLNAVGQVSTGGDGTLLAHIREIAEGDERAVEIIRELVEGNSYQQLPSPDDVNSFETATEGIEVMKHHHARLQGALETVAEMAEDVVGAVEERIGPHTWERYAAHADRLANDGGADA